MIFRIGQKVVCINAKEANSVAPGFEAPPGRVEQDEVYTIIAIDEVPGLIPALVFEEVGWHSCFEHHSFRPLHDDIVENIIKKVKEEPEPVI